MHNKKKKKRAVFILFGVMALTTVVIWRAAYAQPEYLTINVLDVGQGDAIFIELLDGTQILIDGGPDAAVLSELSSVMGPYDRTIDVVIATHADADHIGGLPYVLERYDVSTIVDSGAVKDTGLFKEWAASVRAEGSDVIFADSVKRLRFGDSVVLDILWPQKPVIGEALRESNDYSVVTRLTYGDIDMLLTGDIERWSEQRILSSGVLSDVEILWVPHHGSKTSTTASLLEATSPKLAVISVGADNSYGHPYGPTLERLEEYGAAILRTDIDGRITIQSDGATFWVAE